MSSSELTPNIEAWDTTETPASDELEYNRDSIDEPDLTAQEGYEGAPTPDSDSTEFTAYTQALY